MEINIKNGKKVLFGTRIMGQRAGVKFLEQNINVEKYTFKIIYLFIFL